MKIFFIAAFLAMVLIANAAQEDVYLTDEQKVKLIKETIKELKKMSPTPERKCAEKLESAYEKAAMDFVLSIRKKGHKADLKYINYNKLVNVFEAVTSKECTKSAVNILKRAATKAACAVVVTLCASAVGTLG